MLQASHSSNVMPLVDIDLNDLPGLLTKTYSDFEGDRSEKMMVLTNDGKMLIFKGDKHGVNVSLGDIVRQLAYNGKSLADVSTMIHNHYDKKVFSPTDRAVYKKLKEIGYAGKYQVYQPQTTRLETLAEELKK